MPSVGGQFLHQRILRVDLVLRFALQLGIFPQRVLGVGKGGFQALRQRCRSGGVRFVDDNGIVLPGGLVYLSIDDRELLQRGDDDACAVVDGIPQITGVFVLADGFHRTQLWSKPEMVSCSCASSTVRSVTTMTLANTGLFSVLNREASRYAVQAMELDLPDPALCWMR